MEPGIVRKCTIQPQPGPLTSVEGEEFSVQSSERGGVSAPMPLLLDMQFQNPDFRPRAYAFLLPWNECANPEVVFR